MLVTVLSDRRYGVFLRSVLEFVVDYHGTGLGKVFRSRIDHGRGSHENKGLHWSGARRHFAVRRWTFDGDRRRSESEDPGEFVHRHARGGLRVREIHAVRETCRTKRKRRIGEIIHDRRAKDRKSTRLNSS